MEVVRKAWSLEEVRDWAQQDQDDKIRKYQVVFSEGKGLSWPKDTTWNASKGIQMQDVAG
jgi:hypothetical protein